MRNEVVIDGRLLKRSALRYTPAGTPAIDILIGHTSEQLEAGSQRKARCEIEATAIGDMATTISALKLNQWLRVSGFLTQRIVGNKRLTLQVVAAAPIPGDNHR